MSAEPAASPELAEPVLTWIQPLDGEACGPDLEYDPEFLDLNQTAAGKPETQFSAAEPPQWARVLEQAEAVLGRTRDLRPALLWARARVATQGLPGLLPGLQLLHGLLENLWDSGLHPAVDPDDGDAFARISALGSLDKLDGLLGDVRHCLLLPDRRLGGLRVRDVEVALDRLPPRPDETPHALGEFQGLLGDMPDLAHALQAAVDGSLLTLRALQRQMNDRFGIDQAPEVKALRLMLEAVRSVIPQAEEAQAAAEGDPPVVGTPAAPTRGGGGNSLSRIDSRKDAIRAIQLVCDYLDRSEPTNPAQFLLRRAERLIERNFLQLVRDLAPEAMAEVARIMGVDPDSIRSDD